MIQPGFKNGLSYCLKVINSELYVGGSFDSVAGQSINSIAKWDGSSWSTLNFQRFIPFPNTWQPIYSIAYFQSQLIVGGKIYSSPVDTINNLLFYNGVNWNTLGGGIKGLNAHVTDMAVYKNDLYVAGYFSKSDGNVGNNIQKWDGSSWSEVGGGVPGPIHNGSKIFKMLIFQDKLYVIGNFTMAGNIHSESIAVWDGVKWCSLGNSMDNTILSLCSYNDSLYIGGGFHVIDGDSIYHVAKWIGGSYTDSCQQLIAIYELFPKTLEIFPNPSSNSFYIKLNDEQFHDLKYVIKDVLGKVCESGEVSSQMNGSISFDLQNYESGMYIIQLVTRKQIYLGKLIKQ